MIFKAKANVAAWKVLWTTMVPSGKWLKPDTFSITKKHGIHPWIVTTLVSWQCDLLNKLSTYSVSILFVPKKTIKRYLGFLEFHSLRPDQTPWYAVMLKDFKHEYLRSRAYICLSLSSPFLSYLSVNSCSFLSMLSFIEILVLISWIPASKEFFGRSWFKIVKVLHLCKLKY